jgi:hypothetical protein
MSTPSTPPAATGATKVTPTGDSGAAADSVRLVHSFPAFIDLVVDILDEDDSIRNKLKQGIRYLFLELWRVKKWSDLKLFAAYDVEMALVAHVNIPEELLAPVIIKKVCCIVEFAKCGILTPGMTMDDVVGHLNQWNRKQPAGSDAVSSPLRKGSGGSDSSKYDKKNLPKLEKFSGLAEDYFAWKDTTITNLGIYGFDIFLRDASEVAKYPGFGQSVFYLIRAAVHGGQAQSIAQAMVDDECFDPVKLWDGLEAYYDTAVNRANVVLFDVRKLLNLRLDPDVSGSSFVSDFRDCLQRLRKHKAKLADDCDTLRAFLLVAIQDDAFETVRDSIVQKPTSSIDDILTEIREREATLNLKDHAANVNGDGTPGSRHSRRTVKFASGTAYGKSSTGAPAGDRKWSIPKFPSSWSSAIGNSFFKVMIEWRSAAHQGKTQTQLNDDFSTFVDTYKQKKQSGAGDKRKESKKSRRAKKTKSNPPGSSAGADSSNDDGSSGPEGDTVTLKRIRTQKTRRVITERRA